MYPAATRSTGMRTAASAASPTVARRRPMTVPLARFLRKLSLSTAATPARLSPAACCCLALESSASADCSENAFLDDTSATGWNIPFPAGSSYAVRLFPTFNHTPPTTLATKEVIMKTQIHIASLLVLTILCLMLAVAPAMADTLYDNGPYNGTTDAWTINFGFSVSDEAKVANISRSNIKNNVIVYWDPSRTDVLTGVDTQFGTTPFASDIYSGT